MFFVFGGLPFWGEWSGILQDVFQWDLSYIFLMIRLEFWFLGGKTTEVKCPSYHIVSRVCAREQHEITVDHQAEVMLVRFLHCKMTPFLQGTLWKRVVNGSPHWRHEEWCSTCLSLEHPHKLDEIPVHRRFLNSLLLIHSIVYLY